MIAIERVELVVVRLPLVHEFETSSHRKNHLDHILVRVVTGDGAEGWGECASPSDPYYCGETVTTCLATLGGYLAPMLVGATWAYPDDVAGLLRRVRGNNFARAGLEMACWDLYARRRGEPLADTLGATALDVPAGVSLGIEADVDALLAQVGKHVADGYRRVKLKVRPGWDVEPVQAVRASFGDVDLQVDANGGYDPDDADHQAALRALDGHGLVMIEQPFAEQDLLAHAALHQELDTPVCLDESITSLPVLRTALQLGAMGIVNIKVSRLGGLGPARAVHDACREAGVPVWCGGMHEFGIGRAANIALAALPGFTLPGDVSGSDKYYARDVVDPPIRATDGRVPVPRSASGLGLAVDRSVIDAHRLTSLTIDDAEVGRQITTMTER